MSYTTVLAVTPERRPRVLVEFPNAWGWGPSIWSRLLGKGWISDGSGLTRLWQTINTLPEWQQVPVILTYDTGVIPGEDAAWAADQLDEFERRLPANPHYVNHVPAMAKLLRSQPSGRYFIGVWGTSVSTNPFDPWDDDADAPGSGIPLHEMFLLKRHRT